MVYGKGDEQVVKSGMYPAILTEEEWDRLQQRLAIHRESQQRGKVNVSSYLLSGIVRCGYCGGRMIGSTSTSGSKRHSYYVCANRRDRAAARCEISNSHRADRLEPAVLDFLGQYEDPTKFRELVQAQDAEVDDRQEQELATASTRLKELETGMLNDLDRLDRGVITEAEYTKRAEVRRDEQAALQARKDELEAAAQEQRDRESQVQAVPMKVQSFLEDFQRMDVVKAKAILQTIVKAAHVWRDGKVELEFR